MSDQQQGRNRKIWGLSESEERPDPRVIGRRRYHLAAAKWLARWMYPLQALFALIGFVVVLLPMLWKNWREVIESTLVVKGVFHAFSTFSGYSIMLLAIILALHLFLNWKVDDFPGGWNPTKQWGFPSPKQIVELELYPRLKREEFVYWVTIVFGVLGSTLWMYIFSALAYFIRIRG